MKIGDQRVDGAETVAGVNKDAGIALGRANGPVFVGDALKHAARGRSDGEDPSAGGAATVDLVGGFLFNVKMLGVHQVVGDARLLHGAEGAEPDVQRHLGVSDPLRPDRVEQFRGEMQTRRRGGGGPLLFRVDRLIARQILLFLVNVGRQGKFADRVEQFVIVFETVAVVVA